MSTIAYQSQETLRYATPNAPFKYLTCTLSFYVYMIRYSDEYEFGVQHATVAFRLPDSIVLSEDLLSTNNKAVSFTNLVIYVHSFFEIDPCSRSVIPSCDYLTIPAPSVIFYV